MVSVHLSGILGCLAVERERAIGSPECEKKRHKLRHHFLFTFRSHFTRQSQAAALLRCAERKMVTDSSEQHQLSEKCSETKEKANNEKPPTSDTQ